MIKRESDKKKEIDMATKKSEVQSVKASKTRKPAHLAKIEKFEAQLPPVSDDAAIVLSHLVGLSTTDINIVIAHATAALRKRSVLASSAKSVEVGQPVRIVSHQDSRYIGLVGTVSQVQRIRAYVDTTDGREVYCFISDLEPADATTTVETSEENVVAVAPTSSLPYSIGYEFLTIEDEPTESQENVEAVEA
jgi:hypothetical protein